ncbi:MAG: DNA polymerase II large subunit [Candidatus Thermoplasmatota archaeon]|jgi:DNA polymerase II large subunit|nr:DNA polymerase II large subunit [Candidatus Thermoplasmatota archaeon]MCL5793262.1 DNA polymerase II large subunit [Candidatus Thermoplasmatota archaeon]
MKDQINSLNPEIVAEYHRMIDSQVRRCYAIAQDIRSIGRDVTRKVEIPLATDMADRIEELIGLPGIAARIRELSGKLSREEVAINISRSVAAGIGMADRKTAIDKAVRVGLAILTEGILVAPLEGIADIEISGQGEEGYVSVVYSGPIRGAGGTAQALSVLIADVVRRDLGIGRYVATDEEIERYIEEIESYNRIKHLQYLPTPDEIRLVLKNCPVMIDGEGSEEVEVSGHRDMKRIRTNRIRGGMCLVIGEGLIQKSKKVLKYTSSLGLNDWEFLSKLNASDGSEEKGSAKSEKFLKDIIAGRPVFSHPGRPGGFRLRYGRSRASGLAAAGINPMTMEVLDRFIAVGSQIKIELPGKAAAITPCDYIDGPMVLLKSGAHLKVRNREDLQKYYDQIEQITDVGEILISYGEFLENNKKLEKSPFVSEWWYLYAKKFPELRKYSDSTPSEEEAIYISERYGIPLHPEYTYLYHDVTGEELLALRKMMESGNIAGDSFSMETSAKASGILVDIGKEFEVDHGRIIMRSYKALMRCLGMENPLVTDDSFLKPVEPHELVSELSGLKVMQRAPTRIGARMGRPEKSGDRKMKPKVHLLFPVENFGDSRRLLANAEKNSGGTFEIECQSRICNGCQSITPEPLCEECGKPTAPTGRTEKIKINFSRIMEAARKRVGNDLPDSVELKGVKKLMSKNKACEPVEKGILRSVHGITINKDGTCRYDISDIPVSHFRPEEIGLSDEKAIELGYAPGKINELFVQDIIIPVDAAQYLLKVASFIDDLLVRYYNRPPFYSCKTQEDLIGQLVIGLAPHTSGGIVGRIIGFCNVSGCYAHHFFHAAKRRNCDGDEDSIMLLMDGFLNFSHEFLPSTRGGLMDAPLVLTVRLVPDEVDKEAMNVDTLDEYPMEFYEASLKMAHPSEIEDIMKPMKKFMTLNGSYTGFRYNIPATDISDGVRVSSYKTIGSMEEKIERQLGLARKIRAVDENDVAARVLSSHFLPDIYGNFRGFFSQTFRCTKCNAKYRRVPISGRCFRCGNASIILTVHRGGIVKYLEETIKISREFKIPEYLIARIDNIEKTIRGTFADEPEQEEENVLESFSDDGT